MGSQIHVWYNCGPGAVVPTHTDHTDPCITPSYPVDFYTPVIYNTRHLQHPSSTTHVYTRMQWKNSTKAVLNQCSLAVVLQCQTSMRNSAVSVSTAIPLSNITEQGSSFPVVEQYDTSV